MDPEQERVAQDLEEQFQVGVKYYWGLGVPQDFTQAIKFFHLAASNGHSSAQTFLGHCYYWGNGVPQDYGESVEWFQKAADQDNGAAQLNLGTCYELGKGVREDSVKAVKLYTLVAHRGWLVAQTRLGFAYLYGRGTPKDAIEAYKWLKLAAEQRNKYVPGKLAPRGAGLLPVLLFGQDKEAAQKLASLASTLSPDELQEGERRYLDFKASRKN